MSNVGRPKGVVRKYLLNHGNRGADGFACACCNKVMLSQTFQASKWAEHLVFECKGATAAIRNEVAAAHQTDKIKDKFKPEDETPTWQTQPEDSVIASVSSISAGASSLAAGSSPAALGMAGASTAAETHTGKRQKTVPSCLDRCDQDRKHLIDTKVTTFMVGCAIPFTIANSPFFIQMVGALNSAYKLPGSDVFRRRLLPELFNDVKKINFSTTPSRKLQAVESCVQEGEAAGSIVTEAEMDLEAELCMAGEVIEISDVLVHERAAETLVFGDENETPLSLGF